MATPRRRVGVRAALSSRGREVVVLLWVVGIGRVWSSEDVSQEDHAVGTEEIQHLAVTPLAPRPAQTSANSLARSPLCPQGNEVVFAS